MLLKVIILSLTAGAAPLLARSSHAPALGRAEREDALEAVLAQRPEKPMAVEPCAPGRWARDTAQKARPLAGLGQGFGVLFGELG